MSVAEKINKVMQKVGYLQKDGRVKYGSTDYTFLSEEKITTEISKAFQEIGLIIYPIKMEPLNLEGNMAQLLVTYRIQCVETDDYIDVQTVGEGKDTQDKKCNKAMTAAFKYVQRQTFMIPTGDDPDQVSSEELSELDDQPKKDKESKSKKNNNGNQSLINKIKQYTDKFSGDPQKLLEGVVGKSSLEKCNKKELNKYLKIIKKRVS